MKGRMGRIGRNLSALSPAERIALIQAVVAIPLVVVALRVAGLRRTQSGLAKINRLRRPHRQDLDEARRLARMVTIAGGHGLYRPNCLQRSLVLWAILRRHDIDAELRIGVAPPRGDDGILFHAWLELADTIVNDRPDIKEIYQSFEAAIDAEPSAFD